MTDAKPRRFNLSYNSDKSDITCHAHEDNDPYDRPEVEWRADSDGHRRVFAYDNEPVIFVAPSNRWGTKAPPGEAKVNPFEPRGQGFESPSFRSPPDVKTLNLKIVPEGSTEKSSGCPTTIVFRPRLTE